MFSVDLNLFFFKFSLTWGSAFASCVPSIFHIFSTASVFKLILIKCTHSVWSNPKGAAGRQAETPEKKSTSWFKAILGSAAQLLAGTRFVNSLYLDSETPALSWWTHGLHRNSSTPQRLHLSKVKTRQKRWMMVSSLLQKISKKQESWYLPVLSAAALSLPQSRAGGDLGTTLQAGLFKVIQHGNQNMYVCLAWSQPQRHSIYGSCPCL